MFLPAQTAKDYLNFALKQTSLDKSGKKCYDTQHEEISKGCNGGGNHPVVAIKRGDESRAVIDRYPAAGRGRRDHGDDIATHNTTYRRDRRHPITTNTIHHRTLLPHSTIGDMGAATRKKSADNKTGGHHTCITGKNRQHK